MKKQILILIAVLIALLMAWMLLGRQEDARQRGDLPDEPAQVDSLAVERLILTRSNQPEIEFVKDADGFWNIVRPLEDRVNMNLLNQLIVGLATMRFVDLISERSSQHASFQIDDIQAARLQAFQGGEQVADIYLGKLTPDRRHVYVRPAGGNTVYSATGGGGMAAMRTRGVDDFRSRDIVGVDESVFDSLMVNSADFGIYRVARADTATWQVQIGAGRYEAADANVAEALIRALARMRATGFAVDTLDLDWSAPLMRIDTWRLGDQSDHLEFLQVGDENNYWVRVEGKTHVYKVFESVYKTFNKDPAELKAREPVSAS